MSNGETIIVADADVICEGISAAVHAVTEQRSPWAIPHRMVYRLTEQATIVAHAIGELPGPQPRSNFEDVYQGVAGGGIVVLPRTTIDQVPLDPRFRGWGQEDMSWAHALTMLTGHPWRGMEPLFHLWHEPQNRDKRGVGSAAGRALWDRYRACCTRNDMLALIGEARLALR